MRELSISPVDAVFAGGSYPIEFLLLLERGLDTRRLRASIRSLARPFWPAFGALEADKIRFEGYDEARHYDEMRVGAGHDGSGTVAELTAAFSPFVPRDMPGLVFFRVLRLGRADALLFRMSHLVGDGYSVFFLLSTLAALSRFAAWPLASRVIPALARPKHRREARAVSRVASPSPAPLAASRPAGIEIVRVPRSELEHRCAASTASVGRRVSHNDLLAAMVLQLVAERQPSRFPSSIRLSIPVDVRRRVPAYGSRFFGNGLLFHHLDLDAQRVRALAPEALALEIRGSMPNVDPASYARFLERLSSELDAGPSRPIHPFDPERGCLVTNISRLPIQQLDFGRGRPSRVLPLTIAANSAAVLREDDDYVLRLVQPDP